MTNNLKDIYFFLTLYFDHNIAMGKGISHVYKRSHRNWPYPSPNTICFVSLCFVNPTLQVTTGGISASPENLIKARPLSIPNSTHKLDSSVNIDNGSQSFSDPRQIIVSQNQVLTINL